MIADRLRAAILQAAISGKLTDQRPEDGTATELLEQIKAKRAALVKKKKIKNQKLLPRVNADDQAFVLPTSWSWISFGETISLLSGRDLTPEQYSDRPDGIPYITGASNFANGSIIVNRWTAQPLTVAQRGDLLITCKGTIGDLAVLEESEAHIARQIMAITCLQVRRGYIAAFLEYSVAALKAQAKSMIPGISRDMLLTIPLPLPPLAEQERIVAKLDEVLPLIDQLAELEREREYLDREFAKAIERAILQAAISGKLTKQHPEDGTAEELLETIKNERQQLEKEGKIKKQKPLPPVDKTDEPFDLPDSWVWSRLGRVFNMQAGKNVAVGNISEVGEYPCYGGNGIRGYVADYNRDGTYPIIGRQGALCGNINVASGRFFATEHAVVVETFGHTSPAWAALTLEQLNLNQYATATAQPGLSVEKLKVVPVPVPPVDEQERIAAKLDRALPLARGLGELVS
ncbi:restriction endonuclease subunit S [Pauljensenia sp. 20925_1_91]